MRLSLILLAGLLLVAACGSPTATTEPAATTTLKMASVAELSPDLRKLDPEVQDAYRFALANPDVLQKIPCYCGCGTVGHMDNWMCYIRPESTGGRVVFDYHAVG